MTNHTLPLLRPELAGCPNEACGASDRIGVHSYQERRYKCHACGGTFAETVGTPFYGLKHPTWLVVLVLTLVLATSCIQTQYQCGCMWSQGNTRDVLRT